MGESGPEPAALRAWAVLPAAGSGERLGGGAPKQYRAALGRPLIARTLIAFLSTPWIEHVVVVVAADHMETLSSFLERDGLTCEGRVTLTQGGTTRHRSIRAGLHALARRPGTRPHVAAGMVRPLVSTVVSVSTDGTLDHVLKRSHYRASEMPQAFRFDVIYDAYEKCSEEELDVGTECLHVALHYGGTRARLLDGPDNLWKVTYKKDLYAAEAIMKESLHRRAGWVSAGDVPLSDAALQFRSALDDSVVLVKRDIAVATHNGQGTSLLQEEEEDLHSYICVRCPESASLAILLRCLLQEVEARSMRLREPVAIVAVSFRDGEVLSPPGTADDEFLELRGIASESRQRNVLIYGLLVNRPEIGHGSRRIQLHEPVAQWCPATARASSLPTRSPARPRSPRASALPRHRRLVPRILGVCSQRGRRAHRPDERTQSPPPPQQPPPSPPAPPPSSSEQQQQQ
ncbi:D-ribitol-5-phosphate cytidylyltransferase-like isoform X2 [Lampetra fluviatilis]